MIYIYIEQESNNSQCQFSSTLKFDIRQITFSEDHLAVVAVCCNLEFPRDAALKQLAQSLANKVSFVRVNKLISVVLLPGSFLSCFLRTNAASAGITTTTIKPPVSHHATFFPAGVKRKSVALFFQGAEFCTVVCRSQFYPPSRDQRLAGRAEMAVEKQNVANYVSSVHKEASVGCSRYHCC